MGRAFLELLEHKDGIFMDFKREEEKREMGLGDWNGGCLMFMALKLKVAIGVVGGKVK